MVGRRKFNECKVWIPLLHDDALEFSQDASRATGAIGSSWPTCRIPSPRRFWWNSPPARAAPKRIVATLQLEVAQRLMAQADDDDYGVLTLLVQLDFEPRGSFKIPADCFFPSPNVDSVCVVPATPRAAPARRRPAGRVCENREARVLATAQDDAETVETGLGGGQTGGRICRIKNLAAGTRGEIELGTICGADENSFAITSKG